MLVIRKNKTRRRAKKKLPEIIMVTKTFHSKEESLFPEKVRKAEEMLANSDWRPH
jgi:hypothetical protein